ncbi:MAG TPA: AmpG family muropeptide MFS transporter [Nitrospirales bacterium]
MTPGSRSKLLDFFTSWRMLVVLLLGFSSGLPLALTATTLQAWMKSENADLAVIGLFSLVALPYGLKVLWAPAMDRFVPPFLGRRRGWMLLSQIALVVTVAAMAFSNPVTSPVVTAALAFLTAFFSASQDIVVDAYRTDLAENEEIGPAAALYITGYRFGMLTSGAVALILSDHLSWRVVYLLMAAAMLIGIIATLFAPEPVVAAKPPRTITEAVVLPFAEYFRRQGALEMLGFIVLYKLDVVIAMAMTTPFLLDLGFTKTDIGAVTKGFGLVATIIGTLAGGALMVKLGLKRSLWTFGLSQGISGLSFMLLAHVGHDYPTMVAAITIESFCSGMGTAAFTAFLMSICDKRFTATQYALLTSVMGLSRVIGSAPTGYLAKALGWEQYFLLSVLAMIPGLVLLTRYSKWRLAPSVQEH